MKKAISAILTLVLLLSATISCFAVSDIANTPYEAAVNALLEKGYISGYTDGAFRPERTVTRAEACSIIVSFLGADEKDLNAAAMASFSDMKNHAWAQPAVNYAVEKKILSGYKDGTFRPAKEVTYAELAVMVVNAMGMEDKVTGSWADGYMQVASAQGYLLNAVGVSASRDANTPATRGNVAIIIYNADEKRTPAEDKPETSDDNTANDQKTSVLSDFTGYAYGAINSYSKALNKDDESVTEIELVFGNGVQYLHTKKSFTPTDELRYDGSLYCLKMTNGQVTKIATRETLETNGMNVRKFVELTTTNEYDKVTEKENNRVITTERAGLIELNDEQLSVYVATVDGKDATWEDRNDVDGYRPGAYKDIGRGDYVRVYDVTKDDDYGDVVFVIQK